MGNIIYKDRSYGGSVDTSECKSTKVDSALFSTGVTIMSVGKVNKVYKYATPTESMSTNTKYEFFTIPEDMRPQNTRYLVIRVQVGGSVAGSYIDVIINIVADDGKVYITPKGSISTSNDMLFEFDWFSK